MRKLWLAILLLTPAFAQYDLLLKGGHLIDPKNNIDGVARRGDPGGQDRRSGRLDRFLAAPARPST